MQLCSCDAMKIAAQFLRKWRLPSFPVGTEHEVLVMSGCPSQAGCASMYTCTCVCSPIAFSFDNQAGYGHTYVQYLRTYIGKGMYAHTVRT